MRSDVCWIIIGVNIILLVWFIDIMILLNLIGNEYMKFLSVVSNIIKNYIIVGLKLFCYVSVF